MWNMLPSQVRGMRRSWKSRRERQRHQTQRCFSDCVNSKRRSHDNTFPLPFHAEAVLGSGLDISAEGTEHFLASTALFIMMWEVEETLCGPAGISSYTDNQWENGSVRSFHSGVYRRYCS